MRKLFLGFPKRFDTNQAVRPQKMARGLTFRIKVEGCYSFYEPGVTGKELGNQI